MIFAKADIFSELYQKMVVRKGDIFWVHCEPKVKGSNFILLNNYNYEYLDFRCDQDFFNKHFSYDYVARGDIDERRVVKYYGVKIK